MPVSQVGDRETLSPEDAELSASHDALDGHVFSAFVVILMDDLHSLLASQKDRVRLIHFALTVACVTGCIVMQFFLLASIKRWLCEAQVEDIRLMYSDYEVIMYQNKTTIDCHGHARGIPGYFQQSNFALLSAEKQERICGIPLAHPKYIGCIIFVWTLTVYTDMRQTIDELIRVVVQLPQVQSMAECFSAKGASRFVIGITWELKATLTAFIFIPRLVASFLLLWLGSRWLVATCDLGDVMLNGIALEFILNLKTLVYAAFVTQSQKDAVMSTMFPPLYEEPPSLRWSLSVSCFSMSLVGAWVLLYVFELQGVLTEYRWDVAVACS